VTGAVRPPAGLELLDDPAADPATVRTSLGNIARANRWFGGRWAFRNALDRMLGSPQGGSTISLLDVGTGAGDLPRTAEDWARRHDCRLSALGIEPHPVAARLARESGLPVLRASGTRLPLRSGSVDVVLVSQVAHHLEPEALTALLRECDRVARRAVIVSDLRRSPLAMAAFWVGARLLRFDGATRSDGLLSIRRGFTPRELEGSLHRAGVTGRVWRQPCFRLLAAWRPAR
jgi:2-polyprenyl-3-methyl-5-hydroxy-6-metoxy-1,4-benzoquinol methylase